MKKELKGFLLFLETLYARFLFFILSMIYLSCFSGCGFRSVRGRDGVFRPFFNPGGTAVFMLTFIGKRVNRFYPARWFCCVPALCRSGVPSYFQDFLFLYSVFGTNQVFQFYKQIFAAIVKCLPVILPLFLPFVIMLTFGRKYFRFNPLIWRFLPMSAAFFAVTHLVAILVMSVLPRGLYSPYDLYFNTAAPELSVQKLGLFTTMRLDLKRMILGKYDGTETGEDPDSTPEEKTCQRQTLKTAE